MTILSLYGCVGWEPEDAWLHSSGASLWKDNEHVCTISEERLTRIKYDGSYPQKSIEYCLREGKTTVDKINTIVYVESIHSLHRKPMIEKILKTEFPNSKVKFVNHHIAHAAAVFYTSGFETATILTYDGAGNAFPTTVQDVQEVECGFFGKGSIHHGIIRMRHFLNGLKQYSEFPLGNTYNQISRFIYGKIEPEKTSNETNLYLFMESAPGKIMGLGAYGDSAKVDYDVSPFQLTKLPNFITIIGNDRFDIERLEEFEPEDIAAWLQKEFENILHRYFLDLNDFGLLEDNLCLAGGCALNVLVNTKLRAWFNDIHVFPASNDTGLCFGGGIYESVQVSDEPLILPENLSQLSKSYTTEEILKVVKE